METFSRVELHPLVSPNSQNKQEGNPAERAAHTCAANNDPVEIFLGRVGGRPPPEYKAAVTEEPFGSWLGPKRLKSSKPE